MKKILVIDDNQYSISLLIDWIELHSAEVVFTDTPSKAKLDDVFRNHVFHGVIIDLMMAPALDFNQDNIEISTRAGFETGFFLAKHIRKTYEYSGKIYIYSERERNEKADELINNGIIDGYAQKHEAVSNWWPEFYGEGTGNIIKKKSPNILHNLFSKESLYVVAALATIAAFLVAL